MKRLTLALLVLTVLLLAAANAAYAFKCGRATIILGESMASVEAKCGSPTGVDAWQNQTFGKVYSNMEQWLYNFGPSHFALVLTFENGRLVDVDTGRYGY